MEKQVYIFEQWYVPFCRHSIAAVSIASWRGSRKDELFVCPKPSVVVGPSFTALDGVDGVVWYFEKIDHFPPDVRKGGFFGEQESAAWYPMSEWQGTDGHGAVIVDYF